MTPGLGNLRRLPGIGRVLRALGIGGVPATGYFGGGWSIGTMLLLYWLETVLVTLLVSVLIVVHRRRTRKAGHWNVPYTLTTTSTRGRTSTRSGTTTFLKSFLAVMVPFTAVHGIFVAVFVFLVFPERLGATAGVSRQALVGGLTGIGFFLLASLVFDLVHLGERPFRWVERLSQRAQGRMIVTHLTIIFGAGAMALFDAPRAFLAVFVGLKALLDLGEVFPDHGAKTQPKPPRAVKALGRWLPTKNGRSFGDEYRRQVEAERANSEANEQIVPPELSA